MANPDLAELGEVSGEYRPTSCLLWRKSILASLIGQPKVIPAELIRAAKHRERNLNRQGWWCDRERLFFMYVKLGLLFEDPEQVIKRGEQDNGS